MASQVGPTPPSASLPSKSRAKGGKDGTGSRYHAIFLAGTTALSILLILIGGGHFLGNLSDDAKNLHHDFVPDLPYLTGWRDENGEFFGLHRLKKAPIHYGGLHIVPAIIWCLFIPFQHVATIRRRYPAAHRWMGRSILLSNLVLCLSGLAMAPRNLSYTHRNVWHLHGGVIPTFEAGTTLIALVQLLTIAPTYRTAAARRWKAHQLWARRHTLAGAVISLQRVCMGIIMAYGLLVSRLDKRTQTEWFGVPRTRAEMYEGERAAMAVSAWMSFVFGLAWWYYDEKVRSHPVASSAPPSFKTDKAKVDKQ
ncbi:uncharacterized protein PSFLO_04751 [Pseudozyma flocculosa]|nr:uncharacterized protein PSFLO_04751 [Pseudozyma flocculosa]